MATSALNVFGLDWNPNADLATKQGYVQTLLAQNVTPDQLKAKIGELDPANANQAVYDLLGIPTGALPTAATTPTTAQSALSTVGATGALSADDQLRADMANLSALVNSGQLASLLYPDRTFITRDMLANQPASGLQATGALQGGLSPTNTTSTSTLASDAYQKQLDADALVRGQQRYVLEAEKILGRKLTPEEATSLGQAAYPEIERYTDPKTGVQSYMTPSYDVGSYFRDKLTDEEKQRLDRLIDSSVINAAQQKFPNLPLSIEEQERLKGLYGYEDALTYGGVGMPLDSQGNPKFISELSESDLYNVIVSGVTARQAAENQAAADRAVYDAASREGRAYNGTIYDTKEAAEKAFLDDATSQGRAYDGHVYATKEDADYWRSVNENPNPNVVLANPANDAVIADMERATLERYRNDPDYLRQVENLYGRPLTEAEKISFGEYLFPTYASLDRTDKPRAISDWVNQSLTGEDLQSRRQSLNQGLVSEYDALAQRFLGRSLMDIEKGEIASLFNIQKVADPAEKSAAEKKALDYIYSRTIADANRNNRIQDLDATGNRSFILDANPISTGSMTYNGQVNAVNALRGYGVASFDEIGIKTVPNPDDQSGAPLYQYYNKWDGTNIGAPTVDGQLKIARDDRGIKGGTDVTMYYGQDGKIKLHGTEDRSNLWDTAHSVFQNVVLGQLAGGIASGVGALAGIGGAGAGAAGATAATDLGGLSALGEGAGAAGAAGTAGASSALANAALRVGANALVQAAQGVDPVTAIKNSVISAGTGMVADQFASMVPADVANVGRNAVTQLISTGKIDPLSLATSAGVNAATDALVTETGIDRTTAAKLVTAGVQLIRGNEVGALTSLGEAGLSQLTSGTRTDTTSGAAGRDVVDEYNVTGGGGALISSGNPTEDEQIAIQQRQNAANQALTDYMGSGNDLSREGLVSQLQSLGLSAYQAEGYAKQADQQINMQRVGFDVMNRYSKIDPEFGTPQLERNTAVQELVAAGYSSERANEILNGVDRDVAAARAAALDTKASNQAAINAGAGEFAGADQRAATAAGAGEFAGADTARAVNEKISAAKTFGEAYSEARKAFGAGATFNWQGKLYSTDTFQENPALGLVPVAGSGRGQAAGKTAEQEAALLATAEELKRIDPAARAALLDPASINYSEMSPESNAQGLTQTAADRLVQSAIPVNAIKTAFGMTTEAAGNTLKAFGTIGESLGFNTAQMSDYGRKLENIAQELYPQVLKASESEIKNRFASANSAADIGRALKDSILNNPGAVAKMIGVEGLQELPNIALALATGGTSALIRYGGMLAGLGLDVVESAGLQGAQKVDEGLAKGLTRAQAVKGAVDDMKAAGAVTAVMTAAADRVPFGGTVAKTLIKGSAGEGIEEYVIARATGQDHMSALRQAAFGALIGGPTEASLQGAGNLTNVTINGDTMIGTYEDGTKVSISEPAGATDLKIDIIKPTDTSVNVSNTLTADFTSGADLSTSINNVVSNNITADLSGTIDSTVKAVIDNGVDLSQGVTDLTSAAVTNTGDTTAVINHVVSSLASNGTDLNVNAGSIVTGAVSGGASVTDAVDVTLKAVTANGGNVADAAASIITSVSASGDTAQIANATTAVVNAAITSGSNVTATTSNAVDAALAASGGSTDAVTQVVGGIASQGNNDATAAAVSSAVTATGDTSAAVNAALTNGGDANTVLSTASNAAITAGTDTNTAVTNTLTSALNNNVDTTTAVNSTVKGALDAGADASVVVNSVITTAVTNNVDTTSAITNTVTAALNNNTDVTAVVDSAIKTSLDNGVDTASAVTSVITAALNNNADVSQVVSTVINTAANNNADTSAVIDNAVTTAITNGADASVVVDSAVTSAITNGVNASQVVGSAIDAAVSSGADANTAGSAAVTAAITAPASSEADAASTLTAATAAAVSSGASTDVIIDAVSNATGGSSSVTITSSGSTVTSSTVSGTVTTETSVDGETGNSQTIIADGNTVTQTVTQGSVTTQTQVDTNTNTATVTETNTQTGQTTTTTIDLNSKVVVDVKETVTGGGGEDTLSGDITQDTPLTATLTPSPVSVEPLQVSTPSVSTPVSQAKPQTPQSRVSLPDTGAAMLAARVAGQRSPEDWLGGKLLGSKERDKFYDPLAEFKALQSDQPQPPQSPLAEMAQTSAERGMPVKPYYSYGEEPSIDDILGLSDENSSSYNEEDAVPVFKSGGKVSPLNIQMMYAKGGHTREDFRDGKHVAGPGDGQSDDIPAWLADGEFVFPADVVSALGNGSTKAGTEKLYDMMHEIRRRARSKHPKDLPPPALKSPLDYVKKGR